MLTSDEPDINLTFEASIDHGSSWFNTHRSSTPSSVWKNTVQWWITPHNLMKVASLSLYFLIGCLVYNHFEGWGFVRTFTFSIVTMCTVGYGYRHPTTDESRMFTIFYLIIGVGIVYFYVSKTINQRFAQVLVASQNINAPELVGRQYTHHRRWMIFYIVSLILLSIFGALCLTALEPEWSFITALYFAVESSSTVGYGDLPIEHDSTHIFLSFYIIVSTILTAFALNNFQLLQAQKQVIKRFNHRLEKEKNICDFLNGKENMTEAEFVLGMLLHTGRIDAKNDIFPWVSKFQSIKLDVHGQASREGLQQLGALEAKNAAHSQKVLETYTKMPIVRVLQENNGLTLFNKTRSSNKSTELSSLVDAHGSSSHYTQHMNA